MNNITKKKSNIAFIFIFSYRANPSASSGQALRQAQDRPFGKLRTGPSTSSGVGSRNISTTCPCESREQKALAVACH